MKLTLFVFCVIAAINIASGQQGLFGGSKLAETHPDHPGKCWSEENATAYSVGDKFIIKGSCRAARCTSQEGNVLVVFFEGCPLSRQQTGCKYVAKHPELEYPACCPELVC